MERGFGHGAADLLPRNAQELRQVRPQEEGAGLRVFDAMVSEQGGCTACLRQACKWEGRKGGVAAQRSAKDL